MSRPEGPAGAAGAVMEARSTVGGAFSGGIQPRFDPYPSTLPASASETSPAWLAETCARIRDLASMRDEGRDDAPFPPNGSTVRRAIGWIEAAAAAGLDAPPLVNASGQGEVVFEWFAGPRALTIYIAGDEVTYLESWGADMDAEMEDGDASSPAAAMELWTWLLSGRPAAR